ncbi:MAG: MBL fold metallo-hydrolase [Chloroflexi bacterium]|nr:MBL fold metallo-hydrolase [Chloroflexota bacterium]MBU1750779.1 MBL fold metallo-hydrolase [Chloroflexota bacterium]MBU1879674.1 MBL fold metallo-hydrolase [Chloroflexota bacterium]
MTILELIPNLYCLSLPTPFPCGPINVYLAAGAGPLTLVDTGPLTSWTWAALEHALAEHGTTVADIQRVIVTHAHIDHFGLAARIARTAKGGGAEVFALNSSRPRLEAHVTEWQQRADFYGATLRRGGVPAEMAEGTVGLAVGDLARYAEAVPAVTPLVDGEGLRLAGRDWLVLHTPGHAIGHMCLYQPEARLLLSGDHLIQHISSNPVIDLPAPGETERPRSLVLYLQSLRRVADLDVSVALPGHGEPITDHRALIAQRFQHHEARMDRMLTAMDSRSCTAYEITQAMFPNPSPLDVFLGLSEVIGHLDILVDRGLVVEEDEDNLTRYRRA